MSADFPPPYVSSCDGNLVKVTSSAEDAERLHPVLAVFEKNGEEYLHEASGDAEKAQMLSRLRDAGVAFSVGREWSPAEVFEEFRDEGLLQGPFTEIYWTGPGKWALRTNSP